MHNICTWVFTAAELLDGVIAILSVRREDAHSHLKLGGDVVFQGAQVGLDLIIWQLHPVKVNHI